MKKRKIKHFNDINLLNQDLLDKSFKQFILLSLTDDKLEDYGKEFGEWLNRKYDNMMKHKIKKDELEMLVKNYILLCYTSKNQEQDLFIK